MPDKNLRVEQQSDVILETFRNGIEIVAHGNRPALFGSPAGGWYPLILHTNDLRDGLAVPRDSDFITLFDVLQDFSKTLARL